MKCQAVTWLLIALNQVVAWRKVPNYEAAGLLPSHITTQGQLNEWEFANIARAEAWLLETRPKDILTMDFILEPHQRMFGDTWAWAGRIRQRETLPVGSPPERIWSDLRILLDDVEAQISYGTLSIETISARLHHRLVQIHPFPNGNGRFARTFTDLHLVRRGKVPFEWGKHLERPGEARMRYIEGLRAADDRDYRPLFALLGIAVADSSTSDS